MNTKHDQFHIQPNRHDLVPVEPSIEDAYAGQFSHNPEPVNYNQSESTPINPPSTGELVPFPGTEPIPETKPDTAAEAAIKQIEQAIDVVQDKLLRNESKRGMFGRMLKAVKERVLNMQTEDKTLEKQLESLRGLRNQVETNPGTAEQAVNQIKQEHGAAIIAGTPNSQIENLTSHLIDRALLDDGKELSQADARAKAEQYLRDEEALTEQFFAEGDRMNKEGELKQQQATKETEAYQTKRADLQTQQVEVQATLGAEAPTKQEAIRAKYEREFDLSEDLAADYKGKQQVGRMTAEERLIADWFDAGSMRNMRAELQATVTPDNDPAAELYQAELKRGAKSTRAQTMAFEKYLSGELSADEMTAKLAQIRKEFGPGLHIDYALRGGADHELAQKQIVDQLRKQSNVPELHNYKPSDIEVYRTETTASADHITAVEVSIVIKPEHRIIVVAPEQLGFYGIDLAEAERLVAVDPNDLAKHYAPKDANNMETAEAAAAK